MAVRPVFIPKDCAPYISAYDVEFVYNRGLAISQKQKNITAIHNGFSLRFPDKKVLEISSKSMQEGGTALSAFNLHKFVPSLGRSVAVENAYHSGKVFKLGGPYTDLLEVTPREAKRDERLTSSGTLTGFRFEGMDFPLQPQTLYYDYLYLNALLENEDAAKVILDYDGFTDIEYNPQKGFACQAKSAALFVSLTELGLLDRIKDPEDFLGLFTDQKITAKAEDPAPEREEASAPELCAGDRMIHKAWGEGEVISVSDGTASIRFSTVGEKRLGIQWILENCTVNKI